MTPEPRRGWVSGRPCAFSVVPKRSRPPAFGQPRSFRAHQTAGKQAFRMSVKGRERTLDFTNKADCGASEPACTRGATA